MIEGTKACSRCSVELPLTAYPLNGRGRRRPQCVRCWPDVESERRQSASRRRAAGRSIPCDACDMRFDTDHGLSIHAALMHGQTGSHAAAAFDRWPCDMCDRRWRTARALSVHRSRAHGIRARRRGDPLTVREQHLRKAYGIRSTDYESMWTFQGGRCATCHSTEIEDRMRRLHVDHDHVTGVVRGLLCMACNHALGKVKDDAKVLMRLASYVEGGGLWPGGAQK